MYDTASRGSLAQLVEHRAFNPMVIGSNPIRPTINTNRFNVLQQFLLYYSRVSLQIVPYLCQFPWFRKGRLRIRQMPG